MRGVRLKNVLLDKKIFITVAIDTCGREKANICRRFVIDSFFPRSINRDPSMSRKLLERERGPFASLRKSVITLYCYLKANIHNYLETSLERFYVLLVFITRCEETISNDVNQISNYHY